jgi:hypothetical protein
MFEQGRDGAHISQTADRLNRRGADFRVMVAERARDRRQRQLRFDQAQRPDAIRAPPPMPALEVGLPPIDQTDRGGGVAHVANHVATHRMQRRQQKVSNDLRMECRCQAQTVESVRRQARLRDLDEQRPVARDQRLATPIGKAPDHALQDEDAENDEEQQTTDEQERHEDPLEELGDHHLPLNRRATPALVLCTIAQPRAARHDTLSG